MAEETVTPVPDPRRRQPSQVPGRRRPSSTTSGAALPEDLVALAAASFRYFAEEVNPGNGLIPDSTRRGSPSSIAAIGFALSAYPVAVERGFLSRGKAAALALATLDWFRRSPQGEAPDATGYRGFYYHFLDMKSGRRAGRCELSTMDSAILLAGALTAAAYFDADRQEERDLREHAEALYRRVDWRWATAGTDAVALGWSPEDGFLPYQWRGYDEALILYVLGLGSPVRPLPRASYAAWTAGFRWRKIYGQELVYAGPLFIHQFSQIWLDLAGVQDDFMRGKGIDYFENSRRAVLVQQEYAIRNPRRFAGYGKHCWGLTASDGPGPAVRRIGGVLRRFYPYHSRGVPFGLDDGTVAPWAAVASLPFAPQIVLPTIGSLHRTVPEARSGYGFLNSFNRTFANAAARRGRNAGWVSPYHYGLSQGPMVLMIENYLSGLIWHLARRSPFLVAGLERAGFRGGWLQSPERAERAQRRGY